MHERLIDLLTVKESGFFIPFFLNSIDGRKINWQWIVEVAILVGVLWGTTKSTLDQIHSDIREIKATIIVLQEKQNRNDVITSSHLAVDEKEKLSIERRITNLERRK